MPHRTYSARRKHEGRCFVEIASSDIENYTGTVYYEVVKTPTIQRKLVAPIS